MPKYRIPVIFTTISFIGKDLFDRVVGMTTGGDTETEIETLAAGANT